MLDELVSTLDTPYGRSKWVLEKALRSLEVPAAFYRLGNIGPHASGAYNRSDAQMLLLEACERLGAGVATDQLALEFTPVERVVEVLLTWDRPEVVNVVNPRRLPLEALRYPRMLPLAEWLAEVEAETPVLAELLRDLTHWLDDQNRYESRFGPFDYGPRVEAMRAFLRRERGGRRG